MAESDLEGWYSDPFDRHEARWFSVGTPTKLVWDGTVESHDPPPDEAFHHEPEPVDPRYPGDSDGPSGPPEVSEPDPREPTWTMIKVQALEDGR